MNRLLLNNTDVRGVDSASLIFDAHESRAAWRHLMEMWHAGYFGAMIVHGGDIAKYAAVLRDLDERTVSGRLVLVTKT
ncbi:hypothetical protein [Leucobacter japonicus]|uniref:hypothetical protein n=1 Tax=Leucobacter japonicus TaxID=1461259 RepID=UPI0012E0E6BC|nr:hypothetical protein [Leucobacter japonicus]